MALTAALSIGDITRTTDGSTISLEDSTVYGGGELDRADVVVYLLAFKVDEDLVEADLTIADYDEVSADTFIVTNSIDGHYKFAFFIIPVYDDTVEATIYDIVYSGGTLYKAIQTSTGQLITDTSYFEETTLEAVYESLNTAEEPTNVAYDIAQHILTFAAQDCLTELACDDARENCGGSCKNPKLRTDMETLWTLVYTATVASNTGKYTEGEVLMRMADNYCGC